MYNQGRHFINEYYNKESKFLSYCELDKLLKNLTELNFYKQICKVQVAQQCLKQLNSNYTSYFKALKDFKRIQINIMECLKNLSLKQNKME